MSRLALLAPALAVVAVCCSAARTDPRPPQTMDAAAIRLALRKLNVAGSALYVGAHPDDENTAMLAYLSKGRLVRTAYLSLTRGDGGQNLIGDEIGEQLGVIRTQELLAARRVDGAEQFFSRALDFGFSKNSDETMAIWGHDRILSDVVRVIRRYQPDVLFTRFPPDSTAGHGHHIASAMLAEEAFAAAADPARFPDCGPPWKTKRLMWNAFRFGNAGPDTTPGRIQVDLGAYDPLLGRSYTEIAGEARSMHKSQGFGAAERRGTFTNAFVVREGDPATRDLFEGVNLTWSRFAGGAALTPLFEKALREFDPQRPQTIVPALLRADAILATLPDGPLVARRRDELRSLILACSGVWLEAVAATPSASPGAAVRIVATAIDRSDVPIRIERLEIARAGGEALAHRDAGRPLPFNDPSADTLRISLPRDVATTEPYWLRAPALKGSFEVSPASEIGDAENPPALVARFTLSIEGKSVVVERPVVYRWTDPVEGERYRDFAVLPPVTLRFDHGVYLFADARSREIRVTAQGADVGIAGNVQLRLPDGWTSDPASVAVTLGAGADTTVSFRVTPAGGAPGGTLGAELVAGDRHYARQLVVLDHRHIPVQTLLPPADAHWVHEDLATRGREIGYLMGAGDEVPDALGQMGLHVTMLSDEDVQHGDLDHYGAIVVGVRAYNTRPKLLRAQARLLDYVSRGGRLVVQYQTSDNALDNRIGPYPFRISRDRVTVEEAPVRLLNPSHPLLTSPNRIGDADFTGWVQERGLQFAKPWDAKYESVLSCNDPNEPPRDGGLLYARYGKGTFLYTGYAWFRQLPAGVPGAWRLFANLVSVEAASGPAPRP
jgi:LmbE family N-acetylglucosaminyl deacetylase